MFDFSQNFVHVCLFIIVLDGLIIDHSEIKTSNNPVQKITASLYFVCLLWTIHGISTIGHRKEACLWVAAVVTYAEMMWKPIQRWAWRQQGCQRSQCLTSPAENCSRSLCRVQSDNSVWSERQREGQKGTHEQREFLLWHSIVVNFSGFCSSLFDLKIRPANILIFGLSALRLIDLSNLSKKILECI